jgi:hypothetical protein
MFSNNLILFCCMEYCIRYNQKRSSASMLWAQLLPQITASYLFQTGKLLAFYNVQAKALACFFY